VNYQIISIDSNIYIPEQIFKQIERFAAALNSVGMDESI